MGAKLESRSPLSLVKHPTGDPAWWYDIVEGLPDQIVKDSEIAVWDRPGLGVDIIAEGEFIEEQTAVKVISARGARVVVQPA